MLLYMFPIVVAITTMVMDGDDDNYTDNDDDDDNENDVDEEGESFWLREYDHRKLVSIARALVMYYNNYIYLSLHPS